MLKQTNIIIYNFFKKKSYLSKGKNMLNPALNDFLKVLFLKMHDF